MQWIFTPALVIGHIVLVVVITHFQPLVTRIEFALRVKELGVWAERYCIHVNPLLSPPRLRVSRVRLHSFLAAPILPVAAGDVDFPAREWAMFPG
jgi:hypothetical protein